MTDKPFGFQPVVIIGAGRSGTNILRDTLTSLQDIETWDCDEINPIWRYGNVTWPTDEIPADRASPAVRQFIRGQFDNIWTKTDRPKFIVEKTCANTLRVPFIDAVLPEAKFIHLVRNGFDVAPSAHKRWRGELEVQALPYFIAKAKYVPKRDLPVYLRRFVSARINRLMGSEKRLSTWGPNFEGMAALSDLPLLDLCLLQWGACVQRADHAFAGITPARVMTLYYDSFVKDPQKYLGDVADFLGHTVSQDSLMTATTSVRRPSDMPRKEISDDFQPQTLQAVKPQLIAHRYWS